MVNSFYIIFKTIVPDHFDHTTGGHQTVVFKLLKGQLPIFHSIMVCLQFTHTIGLALQRPSGLLKSQLCIFCGAAELINLANH